MQDEGDKLIVAEKGDLVFVFNFHPVNSYSDYRVGTKHAGPYKVRSQNSQHSYFMSGCMSTCGMVFHSRCTVFEGSGTKHAGPYKVASNSRNMMNIRVPD